MSGKTLKDVVVDHYTGKSLPAETAARLEALARASNGRRGSGLRRTIKYGWIAASIAALAFVAGYFVSQFVGSSPPHGPSSTGLAADYDADPLPRLVAVNIRADWCRRSPQVALIFDEFTEKYSNQPILFVTMDITDDDSRLQARYLASSMNIDRVFREPFESGMIKVVDWRRGAVLATLTGKEQVPAMEGLLAQALAARPRVD